MSVARALTVTVLIVSILALGLSGCGERSTTTTAATPPPPAPGTPITFGIVCAACHGLRGEGNVVLRTPSIAGLPEWYVTLQLGKFRANQRGVDPLDADGQRMHAVARTLSPDDISTLATTVTAMERHPTRNTLGGDATRGKPLYEDYCTACHRYNGSGELAFNSAPLTGLQDWYLMAQVAKFRAGIRGAAPSDEDGPKMHVVANDLTDAHFRDVMAYIAELATRTP
jgi:cytochrome c553